MCAVAEKGDEIPDGDAGDVHIVLDIQEHKEFLRKGCDLYLKRKISLVEALCGFEMKIDHLDGRTLHVQSKPGEVTVPTSYDPFADEDDKQEWKELSDTSCGLDPMAQAELDDVDKLKQIIAKGQLKGKGIGAFAIHRGQTTFYAASSDEIMSNTETKRGSKLYVIASDSDGAPKRMMKCIREQGLPAPTNPLLTGNLFLILEVEYPKDLTDAAQAQLKSVLPPPLNNPGPVGDAEVHVCSTMDPVASFKASDLPDETDDDSDDEMGGQRVQCAQQ
eukprot:SAG31_NODE_112_length_24420_cov_19.787550_7_plen_276_part_00